MILFKCQRCKFRQEVSEKGFFKECPKCHEKLFLNYYENNYASEKQEEVKGGENMAAAKKKEVEKKTEKKVKTPNIKKDERNEKVIKLKTFLTSELKLDKIEARRIMSQVYNDYTKEIKKK